MKYDTNILQSYVDRGLVVKQSHPTLPLDIYNYSRTCQYSRHWDSITLACRGLVLDRDGVVVANPFPKFFNMEEHTPAEIPNEPFEVYEKVDGSLGICFYYAGEWHMATRGSFVSEQAIRGRELLNKYNIRFGMIPGYTYLFEIIYKSNRIVVDYGDYEGLIVLGVYDNATGKESSIDEMKNEGFDVVKKYDGISDYSLLKGMVADDSEGFVIRFKSGMRMKIKGNEYIKLHKIRTNISTTTVWEIMSNGGTMEDILKDVPDELYDEITEVIRDLSIRFSNLRMEYIETFTGIVFKVGKDNRREFAEEARRYKHPSILFALMDNKNIDPILWKIVKPKWEKIFV